MYVNDFFPLHSLVPFSICVKDQCVTSEKVGQMMQPPEQPPSIGTSSSTADYSSSDNSRDHSKGNGRCQRSSTGGHRVSLSCSPWRFLVCRPTALPSIRTRGAEGACTSAIDVWAEQGHVGHVGRLGPPGLVRWRLASREAREGNQIRKPQPPWVGRPGLHVDLRCLRVLCRDMPGDLQRLRALCHGMPRGLQHLRALFRDMPGDVHRLRAFCRRMPRDLQRPRSRCQR